jgi:hypothetical protein
VLETQPVNATRALVLWMKEAEKNPREAPGESYTCPEYTRGHFYSGMAYVSVINPETKEVIHTLQVQHDAEPGEEGPSALSLDLPYKIRAGYYYHVKGVKKQQEGTPAIMHLKDYNGDGDAAEFALFDAETCAGVQTTLIGYSKGDDQVVQYPVHLKIVENGKESQEARLWVDQLFSRKPQRPGFYRFETDTRARGGSLDQYEVRFVRENKRFEGTLVSTSDDEL